MMSPKSIARWQALKDKKLSGRTVSEDVEYKKLQLKHNADVLALDELKWKAELAEAVMTVAANQDEFKQRLISLIDAQIGDDQKPFAKKDLQDFVTTFVKNVKKEQSQLNHAKTLGNNPLNEHGLSNGNQSD